MTDESFKKWLIAQLRRISYRYPAMYSALKKAHIGRNQYKCAECKGIFPRKGVHRDHQPPVIDPATGFTTWDDFIDRLFVRKPDYKIQILCIDDHKVKSAGENVVRRGRVRKSKKSAT